LNLLFSEQQGWLFLGLFLSRQRQNAEELEFYVAYGGPVEIQQATSEKYSVEKLE